MADFLGEYVRDWVEQSVKYHSNDDDNEIERLTKECYEAAYKVGYDPEDIEHLHVNVRAIIKAQLHRLTAG